MGCLESINNYIVSADQAPEGYTFNRPERLGNFLISPMKKILENWSDSSFIKKTLLVIASIIAFPLGLVGALFKNMGACANQGSSLQNRGNLPEISSENVIERNFSSDGVLEVKSVKVNEEKFVDELVEAREFIKNAYESFKNKKDYDFTECVERYNALKAKYLENPSAYKFTEEKENEILWMQKKLIEMNDAPLEAYFIVESQTQLPPALEKSFSPLPNRICMVGESKNYHQADFGKVAGYVKVLENKFYESSLGVFKDARVILTHTAAGDGKLMTLIALIPRISEKDAGDRNGVGAVLLRKESLDKAVEAIVAELEDLAPKWGYGGVVAGSDQNSKARFIVLQYKELPK